MSAASVGASPRKTAPGSTGFWEALALAPKTRRSQPKLRHDPRNRRETEEGTLPAAPASPLAALSEASEHYARATARKATRRLRFSRRLPIGAALAVGAALAFAGRFEYPCGATIQITGENAAARIDAYRRNFLDHAWRHLADSRGDPVAPRWYVDSPAQGLLRLTLISANRRA